MSGTERQGRGSWPQAGHVPALDGVRGLAIALVMVFHFMVYPRMTADVRIDSAYRGLASMGWSGVDLFFVLSGFLITGILLDAKGASRYFRTFYARRFLRIFPLYYGFLAVGCWLAPVLVPAIGGVPPGMQAWYWAYLSNVRLAMVGTWEPPLWINHFWSLAIEEQFYIAWPFVVFALSPRALARTCAGVVVAALATRCAFVATGHEFAAYVLTPCRVDALAVGGLLAALPRAGVARASLAKWGGVALGGGLVVVVGLWVLRHGLHPGDPVVDTLGFSAFAVTYGGLVARAFSATGGLVQRVFEARVLRFFGRYAYGLYVFQQPVAAILAPPRVSIPDLPRVAGSHLPAQLAVMGVGFAITVVLAVASYHLFEVRFLALKRLFSYGAEASNAERAPAA